MDRERHIVEHERPVELHDLEQCLRKPCDGQVLEVTPTEEESTRPVYRAVTMNLVAVAPAADESLLHAGFRKLFRTNPCMAFLVLMTEGRQPMRASFSTVIEESRTSRTVLLEQITLRVPQRDPAAIASIVRPLLVHDLPTLTFWAWRLPRDPEAINHLASLGDLLVFDSALFDDPAADRARLLSDEFPSSVQPCTDLVEHRLAPWRRALAEALEHAHWPPLTPARATIHHTGGRGNLAAAELLADFMAERLGAEVRLENRCNPHAPSFEPCRVELRFDDCRIVVAHRWPAAHLRVDVTLEDRCLLPFTVVSRAASRAELLASAAAQLDKVVV